MSSITFGGLASGLDTSTIIQQLVTLKRQPIVRLQNRISDLEQQRSALGDLSSKLEALMEKAKEMDTVSEFASLTATSANEDVLTATAGSTASASSYDIRVEQLATAQKEMSQGYDSATDSVGSGSFSITVDGETTVVDFSAGSSSLANLKTAINDADAGVTATIMYDGSETGGYHLVLTSDETGTDAAAAVDFSGLSGGTDVVLGNVTTAQNAEIVIDTLTVTSQTNSITSAIEGVTLDLQDADPGNSFTLEIGVDSDAIKDTVSDFVDAYNDLYTYLDQQRADGATLRGDSMLRTVSDRINRIMTTRVGDSGITLLSHIGVTQQEDNLLSFEESDFLEALSDDYIGVRNLFTDAGGTTGIAAQLEAAIDDITDSSDGLFKIRYDGIDDRIDTYEDTIERYEDSVESYEATLNAKFLAMEQMVATLQSQGSTLGSMGIYT